METVGLVIFFGVVSINIFVITCQSCKDLKPGPPCKVDIKEVPYVASLTCQKQSNEVKCAGSILSTKFILTAAHCFPTIVKPFSVNCKVRVGSTCDSEKGKVLNVIKVFKHEDYDETLEAKNIGFNIAIARVSKIEYSDVIKPVMLVKENIDTEGRLLYTVAGWDATVDCSEPKNAVGSTAKPRPLYWRHLQVFSLKAGLCGSSAAALAMEECEFKESYPLPFKNYFAEKSGEVCIGGNGEPLVILASTQPVQVAIGNLINCTNPDSGIVFTKLHQHKAWIKKQMRKK